MHQIEQEVFVVGTTRNDFREAMMPDKYPLQLKHTTPTISHTEVQVRLPNMDTAMGTNTIQILLYPILQEQANQVEGDMECKALQSEEARLGHIHNKMDGTVPRRNNINQEHPVELDVPMSMTLMATRMV
jgi:hypothetical protein